MNVRTGERRPPLLGLVSVAIALAGLGPPMQAAGAEISRSATGSGQTTVAGELRTFSFVAVAGSDGAATGMAQVNNRMVGEMFRLSVDCLNVVGNVAIVSGVFTRHTDAHAVGLTGVFAVLDTGEGSPSPDMITQVFFFEPGVLTCADLAPADAAPFLVDVDAGNVQVR